MNSRERILDAAVALVHEQGLDRVSMSAICARSNVSRGTLYTNFESPDSILAEKWLETGEAWLSSLTTLDTSSLDPILNDAFVDVVVCAPRRLELIEVLRPTFGAAFARSDQNGPAGQEVWAWQVATGLGAMVLRAANLVVDLPFHQLFLALLPAIATAELEHDEAFEEPHEIDGDVIAHFGGDDVRSQLIRAATTVVANTGVEHASSLRICRLARLTPGAFPNHFASVEELIQESFRVVFERVVDQNRAEYIDSLSGPHRARNTARAITRSLEPERDTWRKLRREMLVAARANQVVREQVAAVMNETDQRLSESLVRSGYSQELVNGLLALNRSLTLGMAILHELGLPVASLNHYGMARWLELNFLPSN